VWAERFEGTLEDVFALQDDVAKTIAAQISPAVEGAENSRASTRPTSDLGAYELYLRGLHAFRAFNARGVTESIAFLNHAIARDPNYALALALAARVQAQALIGGWPSDDPNVSRDTAEQLGRTALRLAPDNPDVLSSVAMSLALLGGDLATADSLIERALSLNPGAASAWHHSGWIKVLDGRAELGLAHLEHSLALDPRSPLRAQIGSAI